MFGIETGFSQLDWRHIVMLLFGGGLIFMAIAWNYEPFLLLPIGFGIILVNLPLGYGIMGFQLPDGTTLSYLPADWEEQAEKGGQAIGILSKVFIAGIGSDAIPLFIFLGLGAMTDFSPLIANPKTLLLGAAAQFGVYFAFFSALALGFTLQESASIGIIGGADGPTTIFLTHRLAPHLIGVNAVAAYSYMAMVPLIQPPIIRLLTTKKERAIYMKPQLRDVSRLEKILFTLIGTIIITLLVPAAAPLIGMFMFGNLLLASGVTERLANTAANAFIDSITILLGITVGAFMAAENFLKIKSLEVFGIGLIAFATATAGGVICGKIMNRLSKEPINPMIGAAGVSAVPMSARVVQRMGQKANPRNFLLMHAMGPNVAGVIGTAVAAGAFLGLIK